METIEQHQGSGSLTITEFRAAAAQAKAEYEAATARQRDEQELARREAAHQACRDHEVAVLERFRHVFGFDVPLGASVSSTPLKYRPEWHELAADVRIQIGNVVIRPTHAPAWDDRDRPYWSRSICGYQVRYPDCPKCGGGRWSEQINSLALLGIVIADLEDGDHSHMYAHHCPEDKDKSPAPPPLPDSTPEEVLLSALAGYIEAIVEKAQVNA